MELFLKKTINRKKHMDISKPPLPSKVLRTKYRSSYKTTFVQKS